MLIPRVSGKLPTYYTLAFRSLLPSTLLFTSLAFTTYRWRPSEPYAFYAIGKHGFQTGHGRYPFVCQAGGSNNEEGEGFRINKCFAAFASRREADKFVMYGRVKINGVVAQPGMRVRPGDKVYLDNKLVQWESTISPSLDTVVDGSQEDKTGPGQWVYIKYWKPQDVICTTDRSIDGNIINAINFPKRVFPVGRLDKDSTGLILLTNDGRVPNALLRAAHQHGKVYLVSVDKPISDKDLVMLRNGVIITTPVQRDRVDKLITAKTLGCEVERVDLKRFRITLHEGRNRQIRKMCEALGYEVTYLHREKIVSIGLKGMKEGEWRHLDEQEIDVIQMAVQQEQQRQLSDASKQEENAEDEEDDDWEEDGSGGIKHKGGSEDPSFRSVVVKTRSKEGNSPPRKQWVDPNNQKKDLKKPYSTNKTGGARRYEEKKRSSWAAGAPEKFSGGKGPRRPTNR